MPIFDVVAAATSLLITDRYPFDNTRRSTQMIRARLVPPKVAEAASLLATEDDPTDVALMTWPDLTFVFLRGHTELLQVGYIPGWLRSESWAGGDRRLVRADEAAAWLELHT
ncbi:MAG: hypothetical protein ACTHMS_20310 [Jatrophihabitans sp.]|uniref:hypothetical protein n=1 Tax=Jatrophihabitans sp. TaxID=1932789 RepID=UPI003F80EEFE